MHPKRISDASTPQLRSRRTLPKIPLTSSPASHHIIAVVIFCSTASPVAHRTGTNTRKTAVAPSSQPSAESTLPSAKPISQGHPATSEFMSIENLKTYGMWPSASLLLFLSGEALIVAVWGLPLARAPPVIAPRRRARRPPRTPPTKPIAPQRHTELHRADLPPLTDPFAEADEDTGETKQTQNYIHIRIQQRNGRKTLTTVQGLPKKFDQKKILKVIKKKFACNGTIVNDTEMGEVIQLQGDQRKDVQEFLVDKEGLELDPKTIKVHGF
ncbi:Eukaryotic translation initiation factor eIF-1 [Tolypocladium paradoxum]|uniref:Eukaryotic translation initiation factor eIF-1 n=1 Tax=Tolypocladium paradoxum TaxID=94208 RepID=A0A2S4L5A9_9HYPO|nr:Eukaryotic translation initiation factor eIF-1 [Tolypocladium paradoxum]